MVHQYKVWCGMGNGYRDPENGQPDYKFLFIIHVLISIYNPQSAGFILVFHHHPTLYQALSKDILNQRIVFLPFNINLLPIIQASLVAQTVKNVPAMQETQVQSLGQEDPLVKEIATHSSTLAWRIPWMEESRSQRIGHNGMTGTQLSLKPYKNFLYILLQEAYIQLGISRENENTYVLKQKRCVFYCIQIKKLRLGQIKTLKSPRDYKEKTIHLKNETDKLVHPRADSLRQK